MNSFLLNKNTGGLGTKMLNACLPLFLVLFAFNSFGQLAPNYTFGSSAGVYTPITIGGGATAIAIVGDNVQVNVTGLPAFTVNAVAYTNARVSSNGWIILYSGTAPTATTEGSILSASTPNAGVTLAPMNADLNSTLPLSSAAMYQVVGSEIIFQWDNYLRWASTGEVLNFQARLNTATGVIKYVYGPTTQGSGTSGFQVGFKTTATGAVWATNINNLQVDIIGSPNTCTWANAVTGNANTSTMYLATANPGVKPATGLTYTWTPQAAPDPVRTFAAVSAITGSGATVSWTAPTGATQYNVRYRLAGSTC